LKWWEIEKIHDPKIRDTDLTDKGIEQAKGLNSALTELKPSLIIASPLTRSLRTAVEACGNHQCEFRITPLLREHSYSICDVGQHPSQLAQQWPQFQSQFAELPSDWWCNTDQQKDHSEGSYMDTPPESYRESWQHLQDRIEQLLQLIDEQILNGHETILLVGHAVLFFGLTGRWVDNCQLIELNRGDLRQRCLCPGFVCECAGNTSYLDA
jgi:glucosyl-3-phosphoglycerate phosphatase